VVLRNPITHIRQTTRFETIVKRQNKRRGPKEENKSAKTNLPKWGDKSPERPVEKKQKGGRIQKKTGEIVWLVV